MPVVRPKGAWYEGFFNEPLAPGFKKFMKKICLIILLLLSFSLFSFGKEKKNDSEGPKLKIEAYKDEYIQGQPIIILYEISADKDYEFCLEPKGFVFSIKIENLKGESLTDGKFISYRTFLKQFHVVAETNSYFIKLSEFPNKLFKRYISLEEIVNQIIIEPNTSYCNYENIENIKLGVYNITVKIEPFLKKAFSFNPDFCIKEHNNAWCGEMTSNTIQIKIVEDKKLEK